jgi:hypothetical protein
MLSTAFGSVVCGALAFAAVASTQSTASTSGYVGYNLTLEGDQDSVVYSTEDTRPDAGVNEPDPDVVRRESAKDRVCACY